MSRTSPPAPRKGSLVVVGTGIALATQATPEATACMRDAERLFFAVANPAHAAWVRRINPAAISLEPCYAEGKPRRQSYREMTFLIVGAVRAGHRTCAAFYGHPGVFTQPSHASIALARREGYIARMLPGISAEDCLFADLGVNPGAGGCQSFEASDFLAFRRRFDPTSSLILWQVGLLGERSVRPGMAARPERLRVLRDALLAHYRPRHPIVLYEAAQFPVCDPVVRRIRLEQLPSQTITPAVTVYIPPLPARTPDRRIMRWFDEPISNQ